MENTSLSVSTCFYISSRNHQTYVAVSVFLADQNSPADLVSWASLLYQEFHLTNYNVFRLVQQRCSNAEVLFCLFVEEGGDFVLATPKKIDEKQEMKPLHDI